MTTRFNISHAARIVRAGGVIAYPTEGVYGLGCRPDRVSAIERLLAIKGRSVQAGLILIAYDWVQLTNWVSPTREEELRMSQPCEAPVTWIVTAGPAAHPLLTGSRASVAVRITLHPVARALCREAEYPLVSTSANRSGQLPARRALEVRMRLNPPPDFVLNGPLGHLAGPTEIREAATGRVLRAGPGSGPTPN